ncbi:MAG: hypothetical protein JNN15_07405, partial [Blastocatellia bacterium]|nr:hypothetical protein [Blastocatellia bacterium]
MRRIFLFVSILLLAPALTFADTIILKNGRKINCDVARQEGSIVRYWIGDISLRIAAEEVEKIERNEERGEGLKASPTTDSINSATSTITSEPSRLTAEAFKQLEERVFSGRADQQQKISFVNHLNSLASDAYTKGRREEAKSH